MTEEEELHLSPSRAVWVLLEYEGESRASATALLKITVPQEKPLQRRKITQFKGGSGLAGPCGYATKMDRGFHRDEERQQQRSFGGEGEGG